jgi:3-hydroxy-9,10-secoandrosta-1,3,5(10)-triene-9,17-dione monooxygenase reductase component
LKQGEKPVSDTVIDPRQLREALGSFATGITIVTTRDAEGHDVGLTANSFNSVSLSPPMVLWSLAKSSQSLPAFAAAEYFAVHILALDQEPLSNLFSKRGADKFAGLAIERGAGDVPLLDGCAARFQCRTAFRYEGGDHEIFVGEVIDFKHFDHRPLVFHRGKYSVVVDKQRGQLPDADAGDGSFARDFLGFLLGKAHFRLFENIRAELNRLSISLDQYFALCALGAGEARTAAELDQMAQMYDRRFEQQSALDLIARGLLDCEDGIALKPRLFLTAEGRRLMLELLAIGKDAESTFLEQFDYSEAQLLRTLLKRLVKRRPNPPVKTG